MAASEFVERVMVFFQKAKELENKGNMLRAAEYYDLAFKAAQDSALGTDDLVTIYVMRCQADVLLAYVTVVDDSTADPAFVASHRANFIVLVFAAVTALERRRVAGTLLEGKCTAAEEAWYAAVLRSKGRSASEAALEMKMVGYGLLLCTARTVIGLLRNAGWLCEDDACSATQLQTFVEYVAHAADLMQQPRSSGHEVMLDELCFTDCFYAIINVEPDGCSVLHALQQQLMGVWERLQDSGVLKARSLLNMVLLQKIMALRENKGPVSNARAAMEAPGLRICELAGCGAREAHPQHYKRCAACKAVVYCCREHHLADWPGHKAACKAARKAAAASDSGASAAAAS